MKNILLIEDDPFIVDIYATCLKKADFGVDLANSAEAALEKLKHHQPDLLLLDIVLPKMDGWELLKILRNDPATQNLKVVVISNLNQQDSVENIAKLGVLKYFLKIQSTPEEIVTSVKEILK